MKIKTSAEIIQKTYSDIQRTIKDLEMLGEFIKKANSKLPEWTDKKAEEFRETMERIAILTVQPNETLRASISAMKKMEVAIDKYNHIRLN